MKWRKIKLDIEFEFDIEYRLIYVQLSRSFVSNTMVQFCPLSNCPTFSMVVHQYWTPFPIYN